MILKPCSSGIQSRPTRNGLRMYTGIRSVSFAMRPWGGLRGRIWGFFYVLRATGQSEPAVWLSPLLTHHSLHLVCHCCSGLSQLTICRRGSGWSRLHMLPRRSVTPISEGGRWWCTTGWKAFTRCSLTTSTPDRAPKRVFTASCLTRGRRRAG